MTDTPARQPLLPDQSRIYTRLKLMGPGPAAFFMDACQIYNHPDHYQLETATHLIGHCLREVESAVCAVLLPQSFLAKDRQNVHTEKVKAILAEYDVGEDSPAGRAWLEIANPSKNRGLHKLAHRINLEHPRALDSAYQWQYEQTLVILDGVMARFVEHFDELIRTVEPLFQQQPTAARLKLLDQQVPHNAATLTYLFSKITSVEWLKALWDGTFFQRPPAAGIEDLWGSPQYVPWPQAELLLRFAKEDPALTVEIICKTPTNNPAIVVTFLRCLLELPPEVAAKASKQLLDWASTLPELRENVLFPEFISVFARAGEVRAAVTLANLLLAPTPDDSFDGPVSGRRYDQGRTAYFIGHHLTALQEASPEGHYEVLSGLFRTLENSAPVSAASWYRPRIAPHVMPLSFELRDTILNATRDSAERLIAQQPERAPGVILDLWDQRWRMAQRLALYLASRVVDTSPDVAEGLLLNTETLTSPEFEDEYLDLLSVAFPRLSLAVQGTLLERIEQGPQWMRDARHSDDHLRYWQHRFLSVIKPALTGERLAWADQLEAEFGPYDRDASQRTEVYVGPRSPFTADELTALVPAGMLDLLGNWQDESTDQDWPRRPSTGGLAQVAQQRFSADPAAFAALAGRFLGLHPAYTDALLVALRTAVTESRPFDWAPVLELCVTSQQLTNDPSLAERNAVRRSIGWLLEAGFKTQKHPLPGSLRMLAWAAVEPITDDPNPAPSDELNMDDEWHQLLNCSMNRTRSIGLTAVLSYGQWVQTHENESQVTSGFDRMPEVRQMLEAHLDPNRDSSLAVRAVYGRDLDLLFSLDPDWTSRNLSLIFPASHPELQRAAWTGYLQRSSVIPEVFSALQLYQQATGSLRTEDAYRSDSMQDHLARHLMVLTLMGELSTDPPDPWLAVFFDQASPALRQAALKWAARLLEYEDESVDVLRRARALFEWRLSLARSASEDESTAFRTELAGIGAWVVLQGLGGVWLADSVQAVLDLGGQLEHADEIARVLPELTGLHPGKALQLLDRLLPQLTAYRLEKFGRPVVEAAFADETTREAARDYIRRRMLAGDYSLMDVQEGHLG